MTPSIEQTLRDLVAQEVRAEVRRVIDAMRASGSVAVEPSPEALAELRFGDGVPDGDLRDRADLILDELRRERRESERLRAEIRRLRRISDDDLKSKIAMRPRLSELAPSDDCGTLYAIALAPELIPFRVKVGFSGRGAGHRLERFRTVCPTAILVATWPGTMDEELVVLGALPGRIGDSEVFVCGNIETLLDEIQRILDGSRAA